jgi:hypothetical protein
VLLLVVQGSTLPLSLLLQSFLTQVSLTGARVDSVHLEPVIS